MKLAVIGATGKAGSKIVEEAVNRGLDVTAIVRSKEKLTADVAVIEKSVQELTKKDVQGFDVVVNTYASPLDQPELNVEYGRHLISIFAGLDTRLIVVGGAGSLYASPEKTMRLIDNPDIPAFLKPISAAQVQNADDLKESAINWTFISPALEFDPSGTRTGAYQLNENVLFFNTAGESYVSYADFAIAAVDEVENANYVKQHFTVVSEK